MDFYDDHLYDSKEDIAKCLSCELPECINCLAKKNNTPDKLLESDCEIDPDLLNPNEREIYDYYVAGYKDNEIAKELGINVNTVRYYRKSIGLPTLPKNLGREERIQFIKIWMM